MIRAEGASLIYRDGTIGLKTFDLDVLAGELYYITGPSGSGKTSLLKLLMGMDYTTTGRLFVLGHNMKPKHKQATLDIRRAIGPVFQEARLIEGRSALENVILGMRFLDFTPKEMKENAREALIRVGLEGKISARVENLSFGETQRVAIARAVARKPYLILADEPTGNLDKDNALNILELLGSFRDEKTAVMISTHSTHLLSGGDNTYHLKMKEGSFEVERFGDRI